MEICQLCLPSNSDHMPLGLPKDRKHVLCENLRPIPGSLVEGSFHAVVRTEGSTADDAAKWLEDFSKESRTVWRIQCAHHKSGRKNLLKTEYRCQHNTRHKRSTSAVRKPSLILKNTECPAKMTLILKRIPKRCRSSDKHIPMYPLIIKFKNDHNHSPCCEVALRHRDVRPDVKLKFIELYKQQMHSPGSAIATHVHDLHQELGSGVFEALADRSHCPDRGWCYSLYYKIFNKQYQDRDVENNLDVLQSTLREYGTLLGVDCFRFKVLGPTEFACAIVTPLMRRNHQLNPAAGSTCVIDSSIRSSVHLILCNSDAGGLPLGILISSSDDETVLQEACSMYQSLLDSSSHYRRGSDGPTAFLTDNCPGLRNALAAVFPTAEVLLSVVHLTIGVWRVVCSQNCGIPPARRAHMMQIGKKLLWATSDQQLQEACEEIETGNPELSQHFGRYQEYLREVHSLRKIWSPCLFEREEIARAAESCTIIARDVIVQRLISHGLLQMVHFIFTRLDKYYGRRLEDFANGVGIEALKRRYLVGKGLVPVEKISHIGADIFRVEDGAKTHEVDSSIGCCTCSVLNTSNSLCQHQFAVLLHFNKHVIPYSQSVMPNTSKILFYELATGRKLDIPQVPRSWFAKAINDVTHVTNKQDKPHILKRLELAFEVIREKLEQNPSEFENAIDTFHKSVENMNAVQLKCSLASFGQLNS